MAKRAVLDLPFPLGGLNRKLAYKRQDPATTPDAYNVRPATTLEGRLRGGNRPGLVKAYPTQMGTSTYFSGMPVAFIAQLFRAGTTGFETWEDDFTAVSLASVWSTASWIGTPPDVMPAPPPTAFHEEVGAVRDWIDIDTAQAYTVSIYLEPYKSKWHGRYRIYARLDNTTPDATQDGLTAELYMLGASGAYSGTLDVVIAGVPTTYNFTAGAFPDVAGGWFRLQITPTAARVYWRDTEILNQTIPAMTGERLGFGMHVESPAGGCCMVSAFLLQHYTASAVPTDMLVTSAGGAVWRNTADDTALVKTVASGLSSDKVLQVAVRQSKLYIADYSDERVAGTDGVVAVDGVTLDATSVADWTAHGISTTTDVVVLSDVTGAVTAGTYRIATVSADSIVLASTTGGSGNCSFRVIKAPMVYDAASDSLSVWQASATKGQVPSGCPLVCLYRDRLVLAGDPLYAWYMSRQGDPLDWDYSQTDAQRAVAGSNAEAGNLLGEPIRALVPFRDDFLLFFCRGSIWVLRGDATFGGQIGALSREVGCIGANAWCWGPSGELYFLAMGGLYLLAPEAAGVPKAVSEPKMPRELVNVNPDDYHVSLRYDHYANGVHIYCTPRA